MGEALHHPHNVARKTFVNVEGINQPGPTPRFSLTVASPSSPPQATDADLTGALAAWGYKPGSLDDLIADSVIGAAGKRDA